MILKIKRFWLKNRGASLKMENVFTEKSLKKYPSVFKKIKSQSQARNKTLIVFSAVCYLQNVISTTKELAISTELHQEVYSIFIWEK